ncbi:hypothetical protein AeRB84_005583 [Aphanomyces euteiches]|nr:hypothetical protein AeRB84_005583 [Aphanomyces euteiches]
MKLTALLASILVAVVANESDWQPIAGGMPLMLASPLLDSATRKASASASANANGFVARSAFRTRAIPTVDLKATALLNAANCRFSAQGDIKKYDVKDFPGTYDDCLTKCPREGNSFVWSRGPLGDMLRPTGQDGHCYCKQVPSTFDTKTLDLDSTNSLIFCQFNKVVC